MIHEKLKTRENGEIQEKSVKIHLTPLIRFLADDITGRAELKLRIGEAV